MPVVDVDPEELRRLVGTEKSDAELKADLFALGLEFEGETDDGEFELEFAPDRLDRLSVEGIARSLRYQYGTDRGLYVPDTNDAEWTIRVDSSVPDGRPYVTGAVVRGVDLEETELESLIQLQEKLHATMGRGRAKGAIGVHDLAMLKGHTADGEAKKSIEYRGVDPDGDRFVPLEDDAERTPQEVLETHPTGQEYGDLVADFDRYPAIYDEIGLFSFPPVINGQRTEVEAGSRDLFVEMTGTDQWTIDRMLSIVCYALDARGGRIEEVAVEYDDRTLHRPDLSIRSKTVSHDRIERTLGIEIAGEDVLDLIERAGLDAEANEAASGDELTYEVSIPSYRVDVLHPTDLVDDIGRAYGFNDLEPRYPDVSTVGGRNDGSRLEDATRDALVGLGFEDLLNFHLTNETELFDRMSLSPEADALGAAEPATITEPYSEAYTVVRTWALPSLLMVLENNTHRAYPQNIAEIGLVAAEDETEPTNVTEARHVAAVVAHPEASYEQAKARLSALAQAFGVDVETPPTEHPSFIDGRTAAVVIDGETAGVIGELHPRVLVEHDLEVPVSGFEFRLDALDGR
ncbi:MAG: phenylalanine--tRNA ligase subunit beta [Natronomonas sp.]